MKCCNRHGEEIDEIKETPSSGRGKSKMPCAFKCVFTSPRHTTTLRLSIHRCPRCQGICNCCTCCRAQGLEPTGYGNSYTRHVWCLRIRSVICLTPLERSAYPLQNPLTLTLIRRLVPTHRTVFHCFVFTMHTFQGILRGRGQGRKRAKATVAAAVRQMRRRLLECPPRTASP